jgi:ABC-type sugar transport system permease subunit
MKKQSKLSVNENKWGYLFTLPWMIGFALFFIFPILYSLTLSVSRVKDIVHYSMSFIGATNYANAFIRDTVFVGDLLDSSYNMIVKTPIVVIFALFIAILLNRKLKLKGLFRVAFFLPVLLGSGIVMETMLGSFASSSDFGGAATDAAQAAQQASNQATSVGWMVMLLGPSIAMYLNQILMQVSDVLWVSGIQIIIFLGALQTIPSSYYEAAFCDGASEWEKFWKITLPLTMPTILLNTVFTMINYLSSSDNVVIKYTLATTFKDFDLGYGSAMGWIHFAVSGLLILIVYFILKRMTYYADE